MKSPAHSPKGKPRLNAADLTTRGTPRKRAPGAGRPALADPRCKTLPRVTLAAHRHLQTIATRQRISLADALEIAILNLHKRSKPATQANALAACRSIIFAGKQAQRHGGEYSLPDLQAAEYLAHQALAKTTGRQTSVLKPPSPNQNHETCPHHFISSQRLAHARKLRQSLPPR